MGAAGDSHAGGAEFFLVAGLAPDTRLDAVCVGTSAAGNPHEAGGARVGFRTRKATVAVTRVAREGGDVVVAVAGTLELPARCVAFDEECKSGGSVGCSGRGG